MAIVEATNLVKSYNNKLVAVDNITFNIEKGKVFGFLGPNGAGKSTTIKMLMGLLLPTSGEIKILETVSSKDQIRKVMGYIPQELVFYDHLTLRENAKLFGTSYKLDELESRIQEVFDLLGLSEIQEQIAGDLSGGQKRRLNVALGLLHAPQILVMDEPSAGMDPQSRNILWETIHKLSREDMTIILTTHLMEVVEKLADEICIIDHGKILVQGSMAEIKEEYGSQDIIDIIINSDADPSIHETIYEKLCQQFEMSRVMTRDKGFAITTNSGIATIQSILQLLEPIGLDHINQVTARHHSLEDIFISLTGRGLRE